MNSQGLMIAPTLIYGPFSIVEVQIALTFVIDTIPAQFPLLFRDNLQNNNGNVFTTDLGFLGDT